MTPRAVFPGFSSSLALTSDSPVGVVVDRARGCLIYDPGGKEYLDLLSGMGVAALGPAHPRVAEPVSVLVETEGTARIDERRLERIIRDQFDLTPAAIIDYLKLKRPIYRPTAAHGHFGLNGPGITWDKTNAAASLRKAAAKWLYGPQRARPDRHEASCSGHSIFTVGSACL